MARDDRSKDRLQQIKSRQTGQEPPGFRPIGNREPPDARPRHRAASSEPGFVHRNLGGIGIGALIVIGLMLANFVALKGVGHSLDNHWRNIGSEQRVDLYGDRSSTITAATKRLRAGCEPTLKVRVGGHANSDLSNKFDALPGSEARTVALGDFVDCTLQRDRARFCDATERAIAVADVRQFTKAYRAHMSQLGDLQRNSRGFAATAAAIQGIDRSYAETSRERVREALSDLTRSLRRVAGEGFLSAADFGRQGPPAEFESVFSEEPATAAPCK